MPFARVKRFLSRPPKSSSRLPQPCPTRLNVGCGYDKKTGYLNIDVDPACAPDLLIRNNDYSVIPHRHFEEVYAKDVLEHIPRPAVLGALLDWSTWLKPGGTLYVQTSSILGAADRLREAKTFADQNVWTICLFGNQAHPGDFHHVGFTELTLRIHLLAACLDMESLDMRDGWMFCVNARKNKGWDDFVFGLDHLADEPFIAEIYRHAVGREPSADTRDYLLRQLRLRWMTRQLAAKHLFESPERLFYTAARAGL
jgi:hypothetical protein